MRRLRADVSHRMRRRRPSIFTVTWFRLLMGGGLAVILGLVLGPAVAGWFRGDGNRGPVLLGSGPASLTRETRASGAVGGESKPAPSTSSGPSAASAATTVAPARPPQPPPPDGGPASARPAPKDALFRVQVGAFLDHRNADRLIQRLRAEHLEVADSIVEHSRVHYRVLAQPREGEAYESFLERLRGLGFTPETTDEGALVTAPVPLHAAVETSRRLRDQDIRVRLEQSASAAAFRVVRVGRFASADEAERARVELAGRGVEGFVVREQ